MQATCEPCHEHPRAFEQARAPFVYAGAVREAIHAFKYHGQRHVGRWLAEQMTRTVSEELPTLTIEALIPVPMHWIKQRLKGVNPAAFLACAVAKRLQIPCDLHVLRRTRWTIPQTRLTPIQRLQNVRGAFRTRLRRCSYSTVLLIDDVFTTGATIHACAEALQEAGATRVFVSTAACAPRP